MSSSPEALMEMRAPASLIIPAASVLMGVN